MRRVGGLVLSGACAVGVPTQAPPSAAADPSPGTSVSFQCPTPPPDPQALASCAWHPFPVRVVWSWTNADQVLDTNGCSTHTEASDSPPGGVSLTCTVTYLDGTNEATAVLGVDTTAPVLSPALDRGPDVNGWYNHPVALNLGGSDASSGLTCDAPQYAGPPDRNASLSGTCTDQA